MNDLELTKLAAEKVMGSTRLPLLGFGYEWQPLTDWRAAGEIMDAISQRYSFQLDSVGFAPKNIWRCLIGWGDDPISVTYEATTGPRAITLAALLAVGEIEKSRSGLIRVGGGA